MGDIRTVKPVQTIDLPDDPTETEAGRVLAAATMTWEGMVVKMVAAIYTTRRLAIELYVPVSPDDGAEPDEGGGEEDEEAHELLGVLTVNLADAVVRNGEILVKTWHENEPLARAALQTGLFEDTGRRLRAGAASVQVWRIVRRPDARERQGS
jgi:hypothetical protein